MGWSRHKPWRKIGHEAPIDIIDVVSLGRKTDNSLLRVDRKQRHFHDDTAAYAGHVIKNLRLNIDRMEGRYLNLIQDVDEELSPTQDKMVEIVKKEFRIRKGMLNNIHEDNLLSTDPNPQRVEMYLYHIADTLERMIYGALEQAVDKYGGGDFNALLLEVSANQSGTLYMQHMSTDEAEGKEEVKQQVEEQLEAAEEFEEQLKDTDLPI